MNSKIRLANGSLRVEQIELVFMRLIGTLVMVTLFFVGCSGPSPPSRLPTLLQQDPHPGRVVQAKLSEVSQQRLRVGLALLPDGGGADSSTTLSENSLTQFTDKTKSELENRVPLEIQEVIRLTTLPVGESVEHLRDLISDQDVQFVILMVTSSEEVKSPAYLDASSPDVGSLPGTEVENYALVEMALVDLQSGKSLMQAHGRSYALLEQLDVRLESNRYPLVKGSALTNRVYPREDMALEVLRTVAMGEALEQAIMNFDNVWRNTLSGTNRHRS